MTTDNALLPCPFCGDAPERHENQSGVWFSCEMNDCAFNVVTDEDTAIAAWNTRATTPTPPAQTKLSDNDHRIRVLSEMGFSHAILNGEHVVEGHGFKFRHTNLMCLMSRIGMNLKLSPPEQTGDEVMEAVSEIKYCLQRICEQRDTGRHDGKEELAPVLTEYEMQFEAEKALELLKRMQCNG